MTEPDEFSIYRVLTRIYVARARDSVKTALLAPGEVPGAFDEAVIHEGMALYAINMAMSTTCLLMWLLDGGARAIMSRIPVECSTCGWRLTPPECPNRKIPIDCPHCLEPWKPKP